MDEWVLMLMVVGMERGEDVVSCEICGEPRHGQLPGDGMVSRLMMFFSINCSD